MGNEQHPNAMAVLWSDKSEGTKWMGTQRPEGTRFRFPANIYIDPSWPPIIQMMVVAVRDYGMVLRDIAGSVAFFGEDPSVYGGGDPYSQYFGGQQIWEVMDKFPFDKLQALA